MKPFPKIWALGHKNIQDIFSGYVELTEKIDGSQFVWGFDKDGTYFARSKGVMIDLDNVTDLFQPVVEWSRNLGLGTDCPNTVFYGETLKTPKHNSLAYNRIPKNHFILFGVADYAGETFCQIHSTLEEYADRLGCEAVPLLYSGEGASFEMVEELLGKESILGGPEAEGIVVKSYRDYMIGGQWIPLMAGKFVTEKFKEVHGKNLEYKSGKHKTAVLFDRYKTEERWAKAVQFMRDNGDLLGEPKDIGGIMKRVNQDVEEECMQEIKDALWDIYRKDFIKNSTHGLPQWYKEQIAKGEVSV